MVHGLLCNLRCVRFVFAVLAGIVLFSLHDVASAADLQQFNSLVVYRGIQRGPLRVLVVTDSASWSTNFSCLPDNLGRCSFLQVPDKPYWYKAFLDVNGNGQKDGFEAGGSCGPIDPAASTNLVRFALTEPDSDGDGFTDFEEMAAMHTDPTNPEDGKAAIEDARRKVIACWQKLYGEDLTFTNKPGSREDLQDLTDTLSIMFETVQEKANEQRE